MTIALSVIASLTMTAQGVNISGHTGFFDRLDDECIQTGSSQSLTFTPNEVTGPGISNFSCSVVFSTDIDENGNPGVPGESVTTNLVTQSTIGELDFTLVGRAVVGSEPDNFIRYDKGRIFADYVCTYDSTFEVTAGVCNGEPITTSVTVQNQRTGKSSIEFRQVFNWSSSIVGPKCVSDNSRVTYSIFDYASGVVNPNDTYTWGTTPIGWIEAYRSEDGSSITYDVNTVDATSDQVSVMVGGCNTTQIDVLEIESPGDVVEPNFQASNCLSGNETIWNVNLTVDPAVTYSWDIVGDGNGYTFSFGDENTQGGIGVNVGNATSGFIVLTSKILSPSPGCPDAERTDVISFERGFDNAIITGESCVEVGVNYTYTITGANATTQVDWDLPTGMTIVSADPNATSITVNVTSPVNNGSITATTVAGTCGGNIQGLFNVVTAPSISSITGPTCVSPNSNVVFDITVENANNITWTAPTGIDGGGFTTFNGFVQSSFTGGTITAVASKFGCPDAGPISLVVDVDPSGMPLSGITSDKTCLNSGLSDQVVLTTDAGFNSYSWVLPAGATINGQSGVVVTTTNVVTVVLDASAGILGAGSVTISVSAGNDCGTTDSVSITLSADGAGVVTIASVVVPGANLDVLSISPFDDANIDYQWFANGQAIAGETGQNLFLPVASATAIDYNVEASLISSGCTSLSNTVFTSFQVARQAVSTEVNEVSVSPNPVNGVAQIVHAKELNGASFFVTDMQGSTVYKGVFNESDTSIDVSNWVNNIYLLNYTQNGGTSTIKIQVEN